MQGVTNNVTLTLVLCRGCFEHMSTLNWPNSINYGDTLYEQYGKSTKCFVTNTSDTIKETVNYNILFKVTKYVYM